MKLKTLLLCFVLSTSSVYLAACSSHSEGGTTPPVQQSTDADGDGLADTADNCPAVANSTQQDTDADNQGNACDTDDDNDGDLDNADNCPLNPNADQLDTDRDGTGDVCDPDDDNDGDLDGADNCPLTANADQADADSDSIGDACEVAGDGDNDGIADASDNCPTVANPNQLNTDGAADGGNACDPDDDNDTVNDTTDNCPLTANTNQADSNGTADGDGVGDACETPPDGGSLTGAMLPAEKRDPVNIQSFDGVNIVATVYLPQRFANQKYPLILHSHGWGFFRASNLFPDNPASTQPFRYFTRIDSQISTLQAAGYAVITFDERGWGSSSGDFIKLMNPNYETRDASAILDWAMANLNLATNGSPTDPLVGSIGGSYGGGYQSLLGALDPRIDALIPGATWHNLKEDLAPDNVIKKQWLLILCGASQTPNARPPAELTTACQEGTAGANLRYLTDYTLASQNFVNQTKEHGISGCVDDGVLRSIGPSGSAEPRPCLNRKVDVFLVQGQRDVLFNLNEALDNYRYWNNLGGDVRVMSMQGGHIVPGMQTADGKETCGAKDVYVAMHKWFDTKLLMPIGRNAAGFSDATASYIPKVCISLDDNNGAIFPTTNAAVMAEGAPIANNTHPSRTLTNQSVTAFNKAAFPPSPDSGVFVSMYTVPAGVTNKIVAGVPTIDNLLVRPSAAGLCTGLGTDPTAFVGVGVVPAGSPPNTPATLIDEQVQVIRCTPSAIPVKRLVGVGHKLNAGDQVGLVLYSDHPQYEGGGAPVAFLNNAYVLSGTVHLPIIDAP